MESTALLDSTESDAVGWKLDFARMNVVVMYYGRIPKSRAHVYVGDLLEYSL